MTKVAYSQTNRETEISFLLSSPSPLHPPFFLSILTGPSSIFFHIFCSPFLFCLQSSLPCSPFLPILSPSFHLPFLTPLFFALLLLPLPTLLNFDFLPYLHTFFAMTYLFFWFSVQYILKISEFLTRLNKSLKTTCHLGRSILCHFSHLWFTFWS